MFKRWILVLTTALALTGCRPLVAVPSGAVGDGLGEVVEVEVPDDLDFRPNTTMGRGPSEDPGFFRWASAAGVLAAALLA